MHDNSSKLLEELSYKEQRNLIEGLTQKHAQINANCENINMLILLIYQIKKNLKTFQLHKRLTHKPNILP